VIQYTWEFKPRFRRHAFGWKSQPAIQRLKQAVSEIKKAANHDPVLGAEGAVILLERLSPALEHVDSSSGAIGTAVNNAITELVSIIAAAPVDPNRREAWLERLWDAHELDQIPYIESLADHLGQFALEAGDRIPDKGQKQPTRDQCGDHRPPRPGHCEQGEYEWDPDCHAM
jgi:hypothetical protein